MFKFLESRFGPPKRTIFTIRIVYKSGYTHDFDVYDFKIGSKFSWETVDPNNKPILIGVDDIAAVWQVGVR